LTFSYNIVDGSCLFLKSLKQSFDSSKKVYPKLFISSCSDLVRSCVGELLIKAIARLLEDGQWHTFTEIKQDFSLSDSEFRKIVDFLWDFEIVDIDEKEARIKLSSSFLELPV
jgi:hypothetical protein